MLKIGLIITAAYYVFLHFFEKNLHFLHHKLGA